MTVPPGATGRVQRLTDYVMDMMPFTRRSGTTKEDNALKVHIRGNELLYDALVGLIDARMEARAKLAMPSNPIDSHVLLAMEKEDKWLRDRFEFIYHLPAQEEAERDEQPAA